MVITGRPEVLAFCRCFGKMEQIRESTFLDNIDKQTNWIYFALSRSIK